MAISASRRNGERGADAAAMIAVRQSPGSEVGVPPPQWTCETGAAPADQRRDRSISRSSSVGVGATRRFEPHTVVLQPQ